MTTPIIAADRLSKRPRPHARMRHNCGLLKNYWYVAAQAHEVIRARPIGRTILEERIALWRDGNGRARAVSDTCVHRNAPLSAGQVHDGKLSCPYHGWTYDAEGQVVLVPSEGPDGGCPKGLGLEAFPVRERHGLVWVWMGGADASDKDPFEIPHYDDPEWGGYYMQTRFDNGVTALVENFMDVPHTVFVHKGWFRSRSRKRVGMCVEQTDHSVLVTYDQPQDEIGFTRLVLNPKNLPMSHTDKFYMPNVTRVDYLYGHPGQSPATGFVITSQCTPVGPQQSLVYTRISYKLGPLNPLLHHFLSFYTRRVIEQDVDIMKLHGDQLNYVGGRDYTSTPADTLHVSIEALRDWAEEGGRGEPPPPNTKNVEFWI